MPRLFVLRRDRDITGVSGAGDVADGVQWPDGSVVLRWRERPSTAVWDSLDVMLSVHGHDGATRAVWAEDIAAERRKLLTDVVTAFDVPASAGGPEVEIEVLREEIERALRHAAVQERTKYIPLQLLGSVPGPTTVSGPLSEFADAVMLIVGQLLAQRDRARAAGGRAYKLADQWQAAHGAAVFLVRAAGTELRDALDDSKASPGEVVHPEANALLVGLSGVDQVRAAECSAQYYKSNSGPVRQCIRAAQHHGDHIDERGFHWSDTVAIYPVIDGEPKWRRAEASSRSNPDHACQTCGDCMYEHAGEGGCPETPGHPAHIELVTAQAIAVDLRAENRALRARLDTLSAERTEASQVSHEYRNRADRVERQRNDVAQALWEALGAFREIRGIFGGEAVGYEAPHPIHPSNINRWRAVLDGLPVNCKKPGGCKDCPHETEA